MTEEQAQQGMILIQRYVLLIGELIGNSEVVQALEAANRRDPEVGIIVNQLAELCDQVSKNK